MGQVPMTREIFPMFERMVHLGQKEDAIRSQSRIAATPSGTDSVGMRIREPERATRAGRRTPAGWQIRVGRLAFAARLLTAVALTLVVMVGAGYALISAELKRAEIADILSGQRADGQTFQMLARAHPKAALTQIDSYLDTMGRRPGILDAMLVNPRDVVAISTGDRMVGRRLADHRVSAALVRGQFYAGLDPDRTNQTEYEFVVPVYLPGGRYAYKVDYEDATLAAMAAGVKRVLILLGLAVLAFGPLLFYLLGGRSLMRSHRRALDRARLDGLTDLPNQRAFQDDAPIAVATATRTEAPVALLVVDLDDFRFLNDQRGLTYGDELLKRVADALRSFQPDRHVYRIGGDEFALLLTGCDAGRARQQAERLSTALSEAGASATIGVSALGADYTRGLLRAQAFAALNEARRRREPIGAFEELRDELTITTAAKRDAIHRLLREGGLSTAYQPIWNLGNAALVGLEALTRPHHDYGLSGPAEAFDAAIDCGLVQELDKLSVTHALGAASQLPPHALLFVNLCPETLASYREATHWFAREQVVIEVTERSAGRIGPVVQCLQRLRELGFKLAVDDVGTGSSGLEMLSQVTPEFVKLDRSIVVAAPSSPNARAVLLAMATFARQTGAFVIAEGIEDGEMLEFLARIDELDAGKNVMIAGGQGYGLGRPGADLAPPTPALLVEPDAGLASATVSLPADVGEATWVRDADAALQTMSSAHE